MGNAIADEILAVMDPTPAGAAETQVRDGCVAIAKAIVEYLAANADVRIKTTDAGLQRDPAGSNDPTLGPSADCVLAGALE